MSRSLAPQNRHPGWGRIWALALGALPAATVVLGAGCLTDFTMAQNRNDAAVPPGCGNGVLDPGEVCDGSDLGGQSCQTAVGMPLGALRCTASCQLDLSDCTSCGNGRLDGDEECDDANRAPGDGCSRACRIELGWTCDDLPSRCSPLCGDGLVRGTEQCDDRNLDPGDGCDAACNLEPGWSCHGEPSQCAETCGDGVLDDGEACDDGNAAAGDGCSPSCVVETGWTCSPSEPAVCSPICGDALLLGGEACDDGNTAAGDGCDPSCVVETGWTCDGDSPTICAPICGDGLRLGGEACDDGNATAGDGCDPSCVVETGWTCSPSEPAVCSPICGDGLVRGAEACDDGNSAANDGCDPLCHVEDFSACWGEPSACVCVVYVDVDNTTSSRTGERWASALTDVAEGVQVARNQPVSPCEIWVAEGTYSLWQGSSGDSLDMQDDLHLYGGFAGTEAARADRDPVAHPTVLDGQDPTNPANHVRTVVYISYDPGVIVSGFTITGGDTAGDSLRGGGITIRDSQQVSVTQCRFLGNRARWGGAIHVRGTSTATVSRCVFLDNVATEYGGGIRITDDSSVALEDSLFVRNHSNQGAGAAISVYQCNHASCLLAANNTITANGSGESAIYIGGDSIFWNTIVWQSASPAIEVGGTSTLSVYFSDISGGWSGTGNIDQDPLFVSASTDDYHLQAGSPCIDAASTPAAPNIDLDGTPRVDDPAVADTGLGQPPADMGAYERQP